MSAHGEVRGTGASGLFRNPTAHRYAISDAVETAELIMFASRLRKIVDARKPIQPPQQKRDSQQFQKDGLGVQ
jgi:hypothetical protein